MTAASDTSVKDIWSLMERNNLRLLSIVNPQNQILGCVTYTEILTALYSGQDEMGDGLPDLKDLGTRMTIVGNLPVQKIMRADYPMVTPYDTLLRAGAELLINRVTDMPVVDQNKRVIGSINSKLIVDAHAKAGLRGEEIKRRESVESPAEKMRSLIKLKEVQKNHPYHDKRNYKRIDIRLEANYEQADIALSTPGFDMPMACTIIDIGAGGAYLLAKEHMNVGAQLYVKFHLPNHHYEIEVLARIIERKQHIHQKLYGMRLSFIALTSGEKQAIDDYVQSVTLPEHIRKGLDAL